MKKSTEKRASQDKQVNEPGPNDTATIEDNRPRTVYQRQLLSTMDAYATAKARESKVDQMTRNSDNDLLENGTAQRKAEEPVQYLSIGEEKIVQRLLAGDGNINHIANMQEMNYGDAIESQIESLKNKIGEQGYDNRVEIIKQPAQHEMNVTGRFIYRTNNGKSLEECMRIVNNGQVFRRQETEININAKDEVDQQINNNQTEWNEKNDGEKLYQIFLHVTDSAIAAQNGSLIKSTSTQDNLLFHVNKDFNQNNFEEQNEEQKKYVLVMIIAPSPDDDLVFDSQEEIEFAELTDAVQGFHENEVCLIGGIRADSIIWAAAVKQ